MATYAIGDVQGCYEELCDLLKLIRFDEHVDTLWFTGDLVNRGPRSLDTLRFVRSLGDHAIVVLGNHDLHLLATYYDHRKPGRKDTLDEILDAPDCGELMHWLLHQPLLHHDPDIDTVMIHAGLHPDWDLDQARALAREVEAILRGDKHTAFFQHMYGDKPSRWSPDLNGWTRLRFLTNIFTRLRYFKQDGKTSLGAKGAPSHNPGLVPWFDVEGRRTRDETIIFGHWSTLVLEHREYANVYPIDTGCLWGGKLTALRIDERPFQKYELPCEAASDPEEHA